MGISCTVASNTLTYKWSGIVQWIHDRIKQEKRGRKSSSRHNFLTNSLTQNATHVLTFLQCFRDNQQQVVPRSFLCNVEEGGGDASIVLDLHAMPVNFASVCFVKAVDVARQCLERRLLDLGFVEELAMKVAYLELSNVFTLLDENVTWVCGRGGEGKKLMVSTQFDADAFCNAFNEVHESHHGKRVRNLPATASILRRV